MNEKKVVEKKGKFYYQNAWAIKKKYLNILHLKGTPHEIGFQHGILLSEEIKNGAVSIYADPLKAEGVRNPLMKMIGKLYLNKKIYKPTEQAQPKEIIEQLKGIAEGSGVPYSTIFKANHHTSVKMVMTPIIFKSTEKKFNKMGIFIKPACSTFVATKKATLNGETIVGRNTDYSGIQEWPTYQTISFVEPSDGFKYVQIGTAGVLLWAPGMNENGIVVCGHYMIYDDIDPRGWCIPAFTDAILRTAENLDDAINILKKYPRGVSCGFVVTDGKSKNAFAAEVSTGKPTIRWLEEGHVIMTNMAVSEEKRKIDFVSRYNLNEGCPARYKRLEQLIKSNWGKINPSLAAEFMGDHVRYTTGTERNAYGILAVDDNVNSIVFAPERLKFWVAAGLAPVCNNPYVGFDFKAEMEGSAPNISPEILKGYQFKNENKRKGMEFFNQAYILYEKYVKITKEIKVFIQKALEMDPEEVIYYQMLAKISIHEGHYNEGIEFLNKALPLKQSANEKAHDMLLLGILHDLKGERDKALAYYNEIDVLIENEPRDLWFRINRVIKAFSEKYKKYPFSKKNLGDRCVLIEFSQGAGVE
ncbi:MAG: C45 family autoproteolytic acyltransferase/hydrolase [Promethearchaeota archaeon]